MVNGRQVGKAIDQMIILETDIRMDIVTRCHAIQDETFAAMAMQSQGKLVVSR
jgi:hypothetical protein